MLSCSAVGAKGESISRALGVGCCSESSVVVLPAGVPSDVAILSCALLGVQVCTRVDPLRHDFSVRTARWLDAAPSDEDAVS